MRPRAIVLMSLSLLSTAIHAVAGEPSRSPGSQAECVFSDAEGEGVIVYLVPDGSHVAKGQVVCVLDALPASVGLASFGLAATMAEASYRLAKLRREAAEAGVRDYEAVVFPRDVDAADEEIVLARSDLQRVEEDYDRASELLRRNPLNADGVATAGANVFTVDKARFRLEQAQMTKSMLLVFTREKMLERLRARVAEARADELATKSTWERERARARPPAGRAGARVFVAPIEGTARLARPTSTVAVGAKVCEKQLLLRVVPPGQ